MRQILTSDRLPLSKKERATLQAATSAEWPEGLGAYHFLRFEQLVEAVGLTIDPTLTSVRALIPSTQPNEYHFHLARLIERGHVVLTTNFDQLIEQAACQLGFQVTAVVTESDYADYRDSPESFERPLFKLHGSFGGSGSENVRAAVATEAGIIGTGTSFTLFKWTVVKHLLDSHDLVVVGYSGYDDFDVMPSLGRAGGERRLYWSRFSPRAEREVLVGRSDEFPSVGEFHFDFSVQYHLFGKFGASSRVPANVAIGIEDSLDTIRNLMGSFEAAPVGIVRTVTPPPTIEWEDDALGKMLAGRLLMQIGYHSSANRLLQEFLPEAPDDLTRGRGHLWLAQIAADRHNLNESARHLQAAVHHLRRAPIDQLLFGDCIELFGFPLPTDEFTFESVFPLRWILESPRMFDNKLEHSIAALDFGFRCATSIRRCVNRGDFREALKVFKVFNESPLRAFQTDEVIADVAYWTGRGYYNQAAEAATNQERLSMLNAAASLADGATRVYEVLQRRRKFIDAATLMAMAELEDGHYDWAWESANEVLAFSKLVGSHFGQAQAFWIFQQLRPSQSFEGEYEEALRRDEAQEEQECGH